jgi:SAM-dependent methyltransferase
LWTGRASFQQVDLTDTGLPGGSADAILGDDAFHFASSIAAAAHEGARLLRPGGKLVITTWELAGPASTRPMPERIRRTDIRRDLTQTRCSKSRLTIVPHVQDRDPFWTTDTQPDLGAVILPWPHWARKC